MLRKEVNQYFILALGLSFYVKLRIITHNYDFNSKQDVEVGEESVYFFPNFECRQSCSQFKQRILLIGRWQRSIYHGVSKTVMYPCTARRAQAAHQHWQASRRAWLPLFPPPSRIPVPSARASPVYSSSRRPDDTLVRFLLYIRYCSVLTAYNTPSASDEQNISRPSRVFSAYCSITLFAPTADVILQLPPSHPSCS